MNFDKVLVQLGEFGPWQRRNIALLFILSAGSGINVLIAAFAVMGPRNGFRCRNSCDGEQFSFDFPGHSPSEMFPSLDPESPDFNQGQTGSLKYEMRSELSLSLQCVEMPATRGITCLSLCLSDIRAPSLWPIIDSFGACHEGTAKGKNCNIL